MTDENQECPPHNKGKLAMTTLQISEILRPTPRNQCLGQRVPRNCVR